jgi:hypothetical protein
MLLMVIAGGPATLSGPVVGAALVVLLKNGASAYVDRWIMLLGLVFYLHRDVRAGRHVVLAWLRAGAAWRNAVSAVVEARIPASPSADRRSR